MSTVVFEDDLWRRFLPLSLTRHTALMMVGGTTILEHIRRRIPGEVVLNGRPYLAGVSGERERDPYNGGLGGEEVLFVNARARPGEWLRSRAYERRGRFVLRSGGGEVVAARLGPRESGALAEDDGMVDQRRLLRAAREVDSLEADEGLLFGYPWEMVEENGRCIHPAQGSDAGGGLPSGCVLKGPAERLFVSAGAEVDAFVHFDTREGTIVVEEGARVEPFSSLEGPCFVGRGSRVHSARIRGNTSVGEGCRVGGELECSIVHPFSNKPHLGYLGHSVVGEWVNLGAGSVFSDLKNTYGVVRVMVDGERMESGLTKLGSFVGDMAKVSIGCTVFSGKKVGVASQVMGRIASDVPDFTFFDGEGSVELDLDSVIRTQRRVMARRGRELSRRGEELIRYLHGAGRSERRRSGAGRGRGGGRPR